MWANEATRKNEVLQPNTPQLAKLKTKYTYLPAFYPALDLGLPSNAPIPDAHTETNQNSPVVNQRECSVSCTPFIRSVPYVCMWGAGVGTGSTRLFGSATYWTLQELGFLFLDMFDVTTGPVNAWSGSNLSYV